MKRIPKGPLIGMLICAVMLFGWLAIAVMLTGGRDVGQFTATDKHILIIFAVVEVITLVLVFIFANKVGKANRPEGQPAPQTIRGKHLQKRGWTIFICAFVLTVLSTVAGNTLALLVPQSILSTAPIIAGICAALPVVLFLLNQLLGNICFKRFRTKNVREYYGYILSHRENAAQTAAEKLALLKRLRIFADLYVGLLALIAIGVGFFGSMALDSDWNTIIIFYTFFLFICVVSRVRLKMPQKVYDDVDTMVSREDFPKLYEIADKAAKALDCQGNIKLFIDNDITAGIRNENDYYCIFLGATYLNLLSEDELYCILLHEFCHVDYQRRYSDKATRYYYWLDQGGNPHYLSNITRRLFAFGDVLYGINYTLYDYAASISIETNADLAMAKHGDAATAASALIKLKYLDLYSWENSACDEENPYQPEEADRQYVTHRLEKLVKAIEDRKDAWNELIGVEILSRSATHPTLKMRLDSLGIRCYDTITPEKIGSFAQEQRKAVERLDQMTYTNWSKRYDQDRPEEYLKPKQLIDEWEAAGKPLVEEDYADIGQALRQLGRVEEADRLYQQVIEAFSGSVAVNAQFMHGCFLLHHYDEAGLDHIYTAMENNKNYIDEGLDVIGKFCCITGNQQELDTYREKALDIVQKQKDVYDEIGELNKGDKLSAESLPEGMLERILSYIHSIGQDSIENIYLVKKIITDDFATSAFVVRFCEGTDDNTQDEVLHKIFNHLDACYSWQFSLFDYQYVKDVKVETIEGSCVFTKEQ